MKKPTQEEWVAAHRRHHDACVVATAAYHAAIAAADADLDAVWKADKEGE